MANQPPVVSTLNSLLRGEISAIETYHQALAKLGETNNTLEFRRVHDEHIDAANILREHIREHGGRPDKGSGAWGAFARSVEGAATLFGNAAAVRALKEGEKLGASAYLRALKDDGLPADCKDLIQSRLLPQTKKHILVLDELMTSI
jgi:uncharacterized protein (TIGR02284 family)